MSSAEAVRRADVIVVGCGPVGVMTALRCVQRGLSVIAIDKATGLFPHPRALALDDEGQRLFRRAGLASLIDDETTAIAGAEFVDAKGQRVIGFDLPPGFVTPLGQPPTVMFEQPTLEKALREHAIAQGVDMRLGVEATDIAVEPDQVHVTTEVAGESQRLSAQWLVAADGASSPLRRMLGIALDDQGFDQPWLVVDTTLIDASLGLPRLARQYCDPERVATFVPGHGTRRRWEFQLREEETDGRMNDPAMVEQLLAPWGTPSQLRIDRCAVYRFHGLVARSFRAGRAFLAGDAAHQMPPFNGQGMNAGLRDAENLAWKLALVSQGLAGDVLLDTYDAERRPHSVAAVEHSCDAGRLIDAIAAGRDVSPESGYGGGRPFPHLTSGFVAGDDWSVGRQVPAANVSKDETDDQLTNWFSLFMPSSIPLDLAPPWHGLTIERRPIESDASASMLVRPDGYVAAAGSDIDSYLDELAQHLG